MVIKIAKNHTICNYFGYCNGFYAEPADTIIVLKMLL